MVTALEVPTTVYKIPREVILSYNSKKRIGNYLIGKTIGEGAFAKVKEALHVVTGEKVAVKIIDKTKAKQDSYLWKNLRREVKLLQYMRHPNVVGLYESLETELAYYLVLEHIRGGEMKDYIARSDRLSETEAKKYTRQLISAIWHVHSAGVVHRDLKVENIMLDERGNVKIIDFGLSNSVKSLDSREGRGTQCGSPAYAAPELLANKGYDKRVDIWAIGINMFAMLAGKLPFKVKPFNLKKLYQKMVSCDMEMLPPTTSEEARDLLKKLLSPDPSARITLHECAEHPWLECETHPIEFTDYPNLPITEDLNQEVLQYLADYHNVNVHSLILDLLTHNMNTTTATYHYMCQKFDRYINDKNNKDSSSYLKLETSNESLSSTRNKKTKTKSAKRRPKTAGTITKKEVVKQSSVEETVKCTSRPRRHSIAIPRNKSEKKCENVNIDQKRHSIHSTRTCFEHTTKIDKLEQKEDEKQAGNVNTVHHGNNFTTNNASNFSESTRTRGSVISCKARIETIETEKCKRKSIEYDENGKIVEDGRLLNRSNLKSNYLKQKEKQLIRPVYTPSIRTNRTFSEQSKPDPNYSRPSNIIYNKSNQWPVRQNSAKSSPDRARTITDPFYRPSTTFRWREQEQKKYLANPLLHRHVSFPAQNVAFNRRFSFR